MSDFPLLQQLATAAMLAGLVGFLLYAAWQVWSAATGRRTGDSDEEYEQEPCPHCGYDVRASGGKCPECGADIASRRRYLRALSEDWPETNLDPRVPGPGEGLVMLHSTPDAFEADLLRDQLLARGIRSEADEWQGDNVRPGDRGDIPILFGTPFARGAGCGALARCGALSCCALRGSGA